MERQSNEKFIPLPSSSFICPSKGARTHTHTHFGLFARGEKFELVHNFFLMLLRMLHAWKPATKDNNQLSAFHIFRSFPFHCVLSAFVVRFNGNLPKNLPNDFFIFDFHLWFCYGRIIFLFRTKKAENRISRNDEKLLSEQIFENKKVITLAK